MPKLFKYPFQVFCISKVFGSVGCLFILYQTVYMNYGHNNFISITASIAIDLASSYFISEIWDKRRPDFFFSPSWHVYSLNALIVQMKVSL